MATASKVMNRANGAPVKAAGLTPSGDVGLFDDPSAVVMAKALLAHYGYQVVKKQAAARERSLQGFLRSLVEQKGYQYDAEDEKWIRVGADARVAKEAAERVTKQYGSHWEPVEKAAMGESGGMVGGYLLPIDYAARLLASIVESTFLLPRANVFPMASREMLLPRFDAETTQAAGQSPFLAGLLLKWGSEQAPSETEPTYKALNMTAWDLLGYSFMANSMLADTGEEGEEWIIKMFGKAASWYAEYAFFQGNGVAQQMPLGLLNSGATLNISRAVAAQISNTDIGNLANSMLPYGWAHAIWACNPTTLSQLTKVPNFFLNVETHPEADTNFGGTLLTRPVFVSDKLAALGTFGDLAFFDPSLYIVGMRQDVLIDVSPENRFQTNQTVYRIWMRVDGKPYLASTATLPDATTKVSMVVVLK